MVGLRVAKQGIALPRTLQFLDPKVTVPSRVALIGGGLGQIDQDRGRRVAIADPVTTGAAVQDIGPRATRQGIVGPAAVKAVVARAARQPIPPVAAIKPVAKGIAGQVVVMGRPEDAFDVQVNLAGSLTPVLTGLLKVHRQCARCGQKVEHVKARATVQRVGTGADQEDVILWRAKQRIRLRGADDAVAGGAHRGRVPKPDQIGQAPGAGLDGQAIGADDVQNLGAMGDARAGGGGSDRDRRKRMDGAPGRQVEPVGPKLEVADQIRLTVLGQHEEIGARPAEQGIRPRPVAKDIGTAAPLHPVGAAAAQKHVAIGAADQRIAFGCRHPDRRQRPRIDGQPGDARAFAGHEQVDPVAHHSRGHGGDALQRLAGQGQMLARHNQPPIGHQGHQRQPAIIAPGDDEYPVADGGGGQRLRPGKARVQRVDHMVRHPHQAARCQLDHADRGGLDRSDHQIGDPGNLYRLHRRGLGNPQPLRRTDHGRRSDRAIRRQRKTADHVGLQRKADQIGLAFHHDRGQGRQVQRGTGRIDDPATHQRHRAIGRHCIGLDRAFATARGIEIGAATDLRHGLCPDGACGAARQLQTGGQGARRFQRQRAHTARVRAGDHQMRAAIHRQAFQLRFGRQGQARQQKLLIDQGHRRIDVQRQHTAPGPGGGVQHQVAALLHQVHIADAGHQVQRRCRERLHHAEGIHPTLTQ